MFQAVIFAVFILFGVRMYQMQILDYADAQLAADDNRLSELPIPSDRGVIFDRYDRTLARNVPAYVVTIVPAELPDSREEELAIYNRISALTGVPPTRAFALANGTNIRSIEELVAEGEGIAPFRAVPVAQDVPLDVALRIREERYDLPGVDIQEAAVRQYPTGALTSQIIGYMGRIPAEQELELIEKGYDPAFDRIGYSGLEFYLEDELAGVRGNILREVNVAGEVINVLSQTPPIAGQNLRLTIDVALQEAAEQALIDRITFINTRQQSIVTQSGAVIAMNPMTGEIHALVSYPSYDNTRFARSIDVEYYLNLADDPLRPLVNQTIGAVYPPGSTFKLITASAALEEHIINPLARLFDAGDIIVQNFYAPNDRAADQRFVCWKRDGHGYIDMEGAIANSCNVYFYQVGGGNRALSEQLLRPNGVDIENLFRYATALGIGSELGVELPGELAGRMPDRDWKRITQGENWSTGDTYNAAVGQGYINVTPLQLITAISAIVNNGTIYQPTLVREYLDAERNITRAFSPTVLRTVNLENVGADGVLALFLLEDMIIQGPTSLACTCEENSSYFNPSRCNPQGYRAQVDIAAGFEEDIREYRVQIPDQYTFNGNVCESNRWDSNYVPAFISTETMNIIRRGMRRAVTEGTATPSNLSYITVAGKTGTAEYCDNIAGPLGLCIPGNWPSHAWYAAYAPYENPEILILAFVYNGDEGSSNALPVTVETMEAYVRLRNERENQAQPDSTVLNSP
jgi:penicillin-binding protein 2